MTEDSAEKKHLLFAAFAEVPGPSAVSARFSQFMQSFGEEVDVDAMTLKRGDLAHIQRFGHARLMRVPTHEQTYLEKLGSYTRALKRQLSSDAYTLVYAGDVFSAEVAASCRQDNDFTLVLEVHDLPASTMAARHDVKAEQDLEAVKQRWFEIERAALKSADVVVATSRYAAKLLSTRVDARKIHLLPRAVDRAVFNRTTRKEHSKRPLSVMVLGTRDAGGERHRSSSILRRLARSLPPKVDLVLAGQGNDGAERLEARDETTLDGRVRYVDIDSPLRLAQRLNDTAVVVVPARHGAARNLGVPHRILEAMACGCAVVLDGDEQLSKGVVEPGEGILVSTDLEGLSENVTSLVNDDARRRSLAERGYLASESMDLADRLLRFSEWISELIDFKIRPRLPEQTLQSLKEFIASSAPDGTAPGTTASGPEEEAAAASGDADLQSSAVGSHFLSEGLRGDAHGEMSSADDLWHGHTEVAHKTSSSDESLATPAVEASHAHPANETGRSPSVNQTREMKSPPHPGEPTPGQSTAEQRQHFTTVTERASSLRSGSESKKPSSEQEPLLPALAPTTGVEPEAPAQGEKMATPGTNDEKAHQRLPTSLSLGIDIDTESATAGPRLHASMHASSLSESTIRELVADESDKASDDWAPDTIFDAQPVFDSKEQGGGAGDKLSEGAGDASAPIRLQAGARLLRTESVEREGIERTDEPETPAEGGADKAREDGDRPPKT